MSKRTFTITIIDDDGDEQEHELPAKNEVCFRCGGYGTHCDPNIDGNGITSSEWSEWDQEDRESYLEGHFDVTCEECGGEKVLPVPDEEHCTPEQKELLAQWEEQQESDAAYEAERAYERRMGY